MVSQVRRKCSDYIINFIALTDCDVFVCFPLISLTVARGCVSAPATVLDSVLGHSDSSFRYIGQYCIASMSKQTYLTATRSQVLRSVDGTVGVAEAVALTSILLAQAATSLRSVIAEHQYCNVHKIRISTLFSLLAATLSLTKRLN